MAFPTLQEVVQDVIVQAGLTPGTNVQTYSEPMIKQGVNDAFSLLMRKATWPHLSPWETFTLNGTTGLLTGDLSAIVDYHDIIQIKINGSEERILPAPLNSNRHLSLTGSRPKYWAPLAWDHADIAKLIRFYPVTATGSVDIQALHRPDKFQANTDIVPFDRLVMKLGALWFLLKSDALNSRAAETAQGLFDIAFRDLLGSIGKRDIGPSYRHRSDTLVIS